MSRIAQALHLSPVKRFIAPRSLRYQLLARSLLILSGLFALIGAFQYVFMSNFLYRSTAQNIRTQIQSVPPGMWMHLGDGQGSMIRGNPLFSFSTPISSIAVIDTSGHFIASGRSPNLGTTPHLSLQTYEQVLTQNIHGNHFQIVQDSRGGRQLVVLEPIGRFGQTMGILQVTTPVRPLQTVLLRQLTIFIVLAIVALALAVFVLLPVLRRTLVPLSSMVDTTRRINAGNLDERFEVTPAQEEIELLSVSFNDMLDRLQSSFEAERESKDKMRQFVADASHELRTPLTSIHGFLEVLLRGAASNPEQLQMALKSMYGESQRLTKLVQDLLFLTRLDQAPVLALLPVDLRKTIHGMEPQLRVLAQERKVDFRLEGGCEVEIDEDRIKQVLLNLFQNAVQHTDATEGKIEVILKQEQDSVILCVEDNGIGIPEEHLEKLFERFYRVDSARARSHGGAGLGLAITKSIVEGHHGTVSCDSAPGNGSRFCIRLPRMAES